MLFRGSAAQQVQSSAVQWGQSVNVPPVTNRQDAIAAIHQVTFEGEGIGETPTSPSSHFVRFAEVNRSYVELRRAHPDLDPALPVMCNPAISGEAPPGSKQITDPAAVRAMRLFNDGYFLMLAMLRGFFEGYRGNFGTYPTFAGAAPNSALRRSLARLHAGRAAHALPGAGVNPSQGTADAPRRPDPPARKSLPSPRPRGHRPFGGAGVLGASAHVQPQKPDRASVIAMNKTAELFPGLDKAAVEAVWDWTFEPAKRGGQPVKVYYTLTVQFQLNR